MSTPISALTPYCTAAQFVERFDVRTLGDLLSDTGVRLTSAAVQSSTILSDLLATASGKIEAALLVGNRYAVADLQILTGNSAQLLVDITAGLAIGYIPRRRVGATLPPEWVEQVKEANLYLNALGQGEQIFALQEVANAGLTSHTDELAPDVEGRNLTTVELSRVFGRRNNRYPWRFSTG